MKLYRKKYFTQFISVMLVIIFLLQSTCPTVSKAQENQQDETSNYALFATESGISFNTQNTIINCNVYSKGDIENKSSNSINITGTANVMGDISDSIICASREENYKENKDYVCSLNQLEYSLNCEQDTSFGSEKLDISKNLKVTGGLELNHTTLSGIGYIDATDSIDYFPLSQNTENKIFMCSENGDIYVNGADVKYTGVIYAPNGSVKVNAKHFTLNGVIIAKSIEFNGTDVNINHLDVSDLLAFRPNVDISVSGELKENRKVCIDISDNVFCQKFDDITYAWNVYSIVNGVTQYDSDLKNISIDDESSTDLTKNLIVNESGNYLVRISASRNGNTYTFDKNISIEEDTNPVANFIVSSTSRNPENGNGTINLEDMSYSPDNDSIDKRVWTIAYDTDNDGDYSDEEREVISEGNEEEVIYNTTNVGKYEVELQVTEGFENTIESLVSEENYKSADTSSKDISEKTTEIGNDSPIAAVDVQKEKIVDLVFTVSKADEDTISDYSDRINEIKERLEAKGYTVRVNTIGVIKVMDAQDISNGSVYDHYNYTEQTPWVSYQAIPQHISVDGTAIVIKGYCYYPFSDFLLNYSETSCQNEITFDMKKDLTDWHSIYGGGLLFNCSIENEKITGYLLLLQDNGFYLYSFNDVDIEEVRSDSNVLLKNCIAHYKQDNLYGNHSIKIIVDENTFSLWDNNNLLFDNFKLPSNNTGNGIGPILCNKNHSCDQRSYFTFDNIEVNEIYGGNLVNALNNYEWIKGADKYVINLSDQFIYDLSSDELLGKKVEELQENDIKYIGLGNESNKSQIEKLLSSSEGIFVESTDQELAENKIFNYIYNSMQQKQWNIDKYITNEDIVKYDNYFTDNENDPLYESYWNYYYDKEAIANYTLAEDVVGEEINVTEPITLFLNAGAYAIKLKVRDNTVGDNDSLDEYRKWSDETIFQKVLLVHNKPVAQLSTDIYIKEGTSNTCYVSVSENSYDIDHENDGDRGIVNYSYQWKNIDDKEWQDGIIPNEIDTGKVYLQKLIVTDKEGFTSNPAIAVISTVDYVNSVVALDEKDTTAPLINMSVSNEYPDCGESVIINGYASDNCAVAYSYIYIDDVLVSRNIESYIYKSESLGDVKVRMYAVDIYGNESNAERTIHVSDNRDKQAPTVKLSDTVVDNESGEIYFLGAISDNIDIEKYYVEYKKSTEKDYTIFYEGNTKIEGSVLANLYTQGLSKGEYDIKIVAWDTSGNSTTLNSKLVYEQEETIIGGGTHSEEDRVAPVIDCVLEKESIAVGEEDKLTINVTDNESIGTIEVYKDNELVMDNQGIITFTEVESGTITFKVVAIDASGNKSIKEVNVCVLEENSEDTTAPTISLMSPSAGTVLQGTVSIIGTIQDENELSEYEILCKKSNEQEYSSISTCKINKVDEELINFDTTVFEDGIYDVKIVAKDTAGNMSEYTWQYGIDNSTQEVKKSSVLWMEVSDIRAEIGGNITVTPHQNNVTDMQLMVNGEEYEIIDGIANITFNSSTIAKIIVQGKDVNGNTIKVEKEVTFYTPEDTEKPVAKIEQDNNILTKPTDIIGTVTDDSGIQNYKLEYSLQGENKFTLIEESSEEKVGESLGTIDTTTMPNGIYDVRLTVTDKGGNVTTETLEYVVEGNLKIGNMALSFEDISNAVGTLNVAVLRSYNSQDKTQGDFGYGWQMGIQSIKMYATGTLGEGWCQSISGSMLSTIYGMDETGYHDIVIAYGDGTSDRFEPVISPKKQGYVPFMTANFSFVCKTNPNVKLEIVGDNQPYTPGNLGDTIFYSDEGEIFDPQQYKLTLESGTEVIIDKDYGVKTITDTNGNTVTVGDYGFSSSDGKSITFTRDGKGRITKATDINGQYLTYEYDSRGDLVKVTNEGGSPVSFTYDDNHNLIDIIDPNGAAVARNEYDEDGRLIATIDAEGNRVEYEHDTDGKQEVVRDRMGNSTVYTYDDNGNVISTVDAYGNETTSTFDENNNLLEKVDQLGNKSTFSYDDNNNLIEATNPLGEQGTISYNDRNCIVSITNKDLTSLIINYDEKGNISSTTNGDGDVINYDYTADGTLKGISDDIGSVYNVSYNSDGKITTSTDGLGNEVNFTYDSEGNVNSRTTTRTNNGEKETLTEYYVYNANGDLLQVTDAAGNVTKTEYNNLGQMTATIDEKGRRTAYEHDSLGNVTKITYCDNTSEIFAYDANGNNTSIIDRNGNKVTYEYNKLGNVICINYPSGCKITYEYDAKQRLISIHESTGAVTTYEYDALDRNISIVDAYGNKISYTYNNMSLVDTMTDALGNMYHYEYDNSGNRTGVTYPDGTTSSTEYDSRSRVTKTTDANGNSTSYTYDKVDNLIAVVDALGNSTTYTYDEVGNLVKVTDANGNATKYTYDELGRLVSTTLPTVNNVTYKSSITYDEDSNVISSTDFAGNVTTYEYNDLGDMIRKEVGGKETIFTYDNLGVLTSVTDSAGTISYIYNDLYELTSKIDGNGVEVGYEYDDQGRIIKVKTPYGDTAYEYDLLSRVVRVIDRNGEATVYSYDANGNRTKLLYSNGVAVTYEYDSLNRLVKEETVDKNSNIIAQYVYTLGKIGERLKVTELDSETTYTYDKVNRLTGEVYTKDGKQEIVAYTYDKVGNMVKKYFAKDNYKVIQETNYSYNARNQLEYENGCYNGNNQATKFYAYDANGNLIDSLQYNNSSPRYKYYYDESNHLIEVEKYKSRDSSDILSSEIYTYDYMGNRTSKVCNDAEITRYVVDSNNSLSQVLVELDGSNNLKTYYTIGLDLISLNRDTDNDSIADQERYYVLDGQDSTRALTDQEGTVTDTYSYDAYGNLRESTGETENDFLYNCQQYNEATGLYYLRARYMSPSVGRFISMDEYGGTISDPMSLHKYLYANANPVSYCDPSGYCADWSLSSLVTTMEMSMKIGAMIGGSLSALMYTNQAIKNGMDLDSANFACGFTISFIKGAIQGMFFGELFGALYYFAPYCAIVKNVAIGLSGAFAGLSFSDTCEASANGDTFESIVYLAGVAFSFMGAYEFANVKSYRATSVAESSEGGKETELCLPDEYYTNLNKDIQNGYQAPNTKQTYKRLGNTSHEVETSVVISDKYGRIQYRVDYSTHGNDLAHTNPHIHEFVGNTTKGDYQIRELRFFIDESTGKMRLGKANNNGTNNWLD